MKILKKHFYLLLKKALGPLRPFKKLKKYLPKSLLGRSLIILVTPLILVQVVLSYVFFDRHTETVLKLLSTTIAGDIEMVCDMVHHGQNLPHIITLAQRNLKLNVTVEPERRLEKTGLSKSSWLRDFMGHALDAHLTYPYYLTMSRRFIHIDVQLPHSVVHIVTARRRLFSSTTPRVLIWTTISAILLFLVASLFMRNQIRPIRRLAKASNRFGKGQNVDTFKPEGAEEVRKAGKAFIQMRQRLQRYLTERTEMLAGVSHDLRTPLTRMQLQLEMLPRSPEVNSLKKDVTAMTSMVQGFLSFARGAENEKSTPINLRETLEKAICDVRNAPIQIKLKCPSTTFISLKKSLFNRCLTNLLLNSGQYASHAWITAHPVKDGIQITIEDNGPGIPKAYWQDVFRPFYRVDHARNQNQGERTGLGLSIAQDGILSHGGTIALNDAPQGGLQVTIQLPV